MSKIITENNKLKLLGVFSFLLGFQAALIAYVTSSFLKETSKIGNVGIFYFFSYGAALLVLFNMHHLVKRYGKSKVFIFFLLMKTIGLIGSGIFATNVMGTIFAVWVLMAGPLMWVGLDILIESFSKDSITGTIRGKHLAIMNAGWLLAPYCAAWLVESYGYRWVYLTAGSLALMVLLLSISRLGYINHNIKRDLKIKEVILKMWKNGNIARIYYVAFMLEFFYAAMVVYTPLYMQKIGFSWLEIGEVFTVMLIPFVVLQYPMGVLADRKTGEKELLLVSVLIMAIFTGIISFMDSKDMIAWMVILFLTRVGAAIMEVLRDSYFYKQINPEDVDVIDFYRTTRCLSYIVTAAFFSLYIAIFSLQSVFIILALIVLTSIVPLWNLKDTK